MTGHPDRVQVFDSADRFLHLAGGVLLLGALLTGAALYAGSRGLLPLLHAACAFGALAAWAGHLARFTASWLDKGSEFPLLARARDLADGAADFFGRPKLRARGFRQRLPYTFLMIAAPLMAASGVLAAHPAFTVSHLSPATLTTIARAHEFAGFLCLGALVYHLYHAMLCPSALWWNPALFTGCQPWEYYAALNPDSAAEYSEKKEEAEAVEEEKGPGVEELLNRGNAAAKAGDFKAAADHFREALRIFPGYPQALFNLGASLYKLGDRAGARAALTQYLDIDAFGSASDRARAILDEIGGEGEK